MAPRGSSIVLKCTFDSLEDCAWERRGGYVIQMNRKYHYFQNDIQQSHDCSLKIENFHQKDAGPWKCYVYSDIVENDPIDVKESSVYLYGKQNCTIVFITCW